MKRTDIVFIAFKDYDNLGIGYMAALLADSGYSSCILDFRRSKREILQKIRLLKPQIVGFSIVFLQNIGTFRDLIKYLREGGIDCHFTAGGHYASLRFRELFELIPQLDSIVRFEGEYTFLELAKRVINKADWKKIHGVAVIKDGLPCSNPLRPLEDDLDNFPFPARLPLKNYAAGKKYAPILAGRGCIYSCSFCNTRKFYSVPPGPVKRIRKAEAVVSEMDYLSKEKNCSVFLFQDDDFPVNPKSNKDWIERFCTEIERRDLTGKITWKINCRPDEVEESTFNLMKKQGLFQTFLGIEDGTDIGLKRMNKGMSVSKTLSGISILKKLKIGFDYGFILFQPQTTFDSLLENLEFLREICGDGYSPVPFQKLIPIYDTKVEKELIKSGRLFCKDGYPDYLFMEESMNSYYDFSSRCFSDWMRDPEGIYNISRCARNYFSVYLSFNQSDKEVSKYKRKIVKLVSESNLFFINTMKELALIFRNGQYPDDKNLLNYYRELIHSKSERYKYLINCTMAEFLDVIAINESNLS